mmetsp:Transcript_13568/g.22690  ORF Transcript_13568/g.22690 Transcript_13568/m.22690 type:complete len:556 (+) Transcript_13568:178-1845(+)
MENVAEIPQKSVTLNEEDVVLSFKCPKWKQAMKKGSQLYVTGSPQCMGAWDPEKAVPLTGDAVYLHVSSSSIPFEFKFIVMNTEKIIWQRGENFKITKPSDKFVASVQMYMGEVTTRKLEAITKDEHYDWESYSWGIVGDGRISVEVGSDSVYIDRDCRIGRLLQEAQAEILRLQSLLDKLRSQLRNEADTANSIILSEEGIATAYRTEIEELQAEVTTLRAEAEELRNALLKERQDSEHQLDYLAREMAQRDNLLSRTQSMETDLKQLEIMREKLTYERTRSEAMKMELQVLQAEKNSLEAERDALKAEREALDAEMLLTKGGLSTVRGSFRSEQTTEELSLERTRVQELRKELEIKLPALSSLKVKLDEALEDKESLSTELSTDRKRMDELRIELKTKEEEIKTLQTTLQSTSDLLQGEKQNHEASKALVESLKADLDQAHSEVTGLKSEIGRLNVSYEQERKQAQLLKHQCDALKAVPVVKMHSVEEHVKLSNQLQEIVAERDLLMSKVAESQLQIASLHDSLKESAPNPIVEWAKMGAAAVGIVLIFILKK